MNSDIEKSTILKIKNNQNTINRSLLVSMRLVPIFWASDVTLAGLAALTIVALECANKTYCYLRLEDISERCSTSVSGVLHALNAIGEKGELFFHIKTDGDEDKIEAISIGPTWTHIIKVAYEDHDRLLKILDIIDEPWCNDYRIKQISTFDSKNNIQAYLDEDYTLGYDRDPN